MSFIRFQDTDAPLELGGCDELVPLLRRILPHWPASIAADAPATRPFFRIVPSAAKPGFYISQNLIEAHPARQMDGLNAICDMVAALSVALPEADPRVLCLHAAAVEIDGRLVLFPNARRAGKSTLTAALARRGLRVFTDDFLPVRYDADGRLVGRANGVLPRVRLPLPDSLPCGFRDWVTGQDGPENRQYKYLPEACVAPAGETAPIGAIMLLNRGEDGAARLDPMPADSAMDTLLKQNFTRDRHSGDILTLMARLLESLPPMQLSYSDADEAADCILSALNEWDAPVPRHPAPENPGLSKADLDATGAAFDPARAHVQRPGSSLAAVGGALYLADRDGSGIHRLNPVSAAIWDLLADPITKDEIDALLGEAFPGTDPAVISADTSAFLGRLAQSGLIAPAF